MEEEKITLDRESFRALASDTRVAILKSLGKRRKMLTELSKQMDMSPSTVKEHMDNLSKAGLVVQIDDGHKWKYYELTRKGENILNPVDTRIWIILSVSILGMIAVAWDVMRTSLWSYPQMFSANSADEWARAPLAGGMQTITESAPKAADAAIQNAAPAIPYVHIAVLVILGAVVALCAFRILRKRS